MTSLAIKYNFLKIPFAYIGFKTPYALTKTPIYTTFKFLGNKSSFIARISMSLGLGYSLFKTNENKIPSYIDSIHNLPHRVRSILSENWKSDDSDSDLEGFEFTSNVDSDADEPYHEDSGRLDTSDSDDDFVMSERSDKSDKSDAEN